MGILESFGVDIKAIEVEKQTGSFELVPAGKYQVKVTDWDQVESKSGRPMLKLTWEIQLGEYRGRKLFSNHLLDHEVALKIFLQWMVNCGHDKAKLEKMKSFNDLIDTKGTAKVVVTKAEGYDDKNEIKGVFEWTGIIGDKERPDFSKPNDTQSKEEENGIPF